MPNHHDDRADTRKKILDLAETLLLTRGFNAFSYQHISQALGMRNAAIHYHYPRKTDLGVALIERYVRRFGRYVEAQSALPPQGQLMQYFALSDAYLARQQVCPSGILSTELPTLPLEMQQAAGQFVTAMQAWAVDIVRQGAANGSMVYAGSAEAMGALVFSAMQGALQLARFDEAAMPRVKQQIMQMLGLPGAADTQAQHTRGSC